MKLLSIRLEGDCHAGALVGEEVLDFCSFKGFSVYKEGPPGNAANLRDALDLLAAGPDWVRSQIELVRNDAKLADQCRKAGALSPLANTRLGSPIASPGKILAVGLNYRAHAIETGGQLPDRPLIFSKCVTALGGPGDEIRIPRISDKIDYEAELAFVIGKEAKNVSADSAMDYIAGYTIMNDVTARDLQRTERQWVRAKGLDTFAPCGPWMVTADELTDPHSLDIELRLNGEERQKSNTNDLIFKIPELVAFISEDLTFRPGDIVTTGTPSGVGYAMKPPSFLKAGDRIEITVQGIGTLANVVG